MTQQKIDNPTNDLKPFKHGEEDTHYACDEILYKLEEGDEFITPCCACIGHACQTEDWEKRFDKSELALRIDAVEVYAQLDGFPGYHGQTIKDFIRTEIQAAEQRGYDRGYNRGYEVRKENQ